MKTKFVVAYQDELNTALFLNKDGYTTDPYEASQFDGFESAKSAQSIAEIESPPHRFLVILTFDSIKHERPHPIRRMLDESVTV